MLELNEQRVDELLAIGLRADEAGELREAEHLSVCVVGFDESVLPALERGILARSGKGRGTRYSVIDLDEESRR